MTRAAWDATPTDYQTRLLLAALDDSQHRIPSDAKSRTVGIMLKREWVQARRLTSTLAFAESGAKVYVLTHHGVNAAQRARTAQLAEKYPVGAAAVFTPQGATERDVVVVNSGPDEKGTVEVLSAKQGGKALRAPLAALEELPELPPAPEGDPTDYWTVTDDKGQEVTLVRAETMEDARAEVEKDPQAAAVAERLGGLFYRRVRTSELPPAIRAAVEAEAAGRADWWAVKDRAGNLITQVLATSYDHAVQVADHDPKVRAARPGSGGLVFMRGGSVEKPAPAAAQPRKTVPAAAPARRTITVTTGFTRKSIPTRLRESGAPGRMQYSNAAGALRWVLPNGQELTPGEAEDMFLR